MPNPLLEFDSPRKFQNDPANNGGKKLNATGIVQLGPGIVATLEPASPLPGEVQTLVLETTGATAAEFAELEDAVGTAQEDIAELDGRVALVEGAIPGIAEYAVAGGRWDMPDVSTIDVPAIIGQMVRIDMTGKASPDIVIVTLPLSNAGNKGRSIGVITVNNGGADAGSIVRTITSGGQGIGVDYGPLLNNTGELRVIFVSNGSGWDIVSLP
jgi:hypothetical protein